MKAVRTRLVFWNVLAIGVILGAMGLALRYQLRANLLAQIDRDLQRDAARVSAVHKDGAESVGQLETEFGRNFFGNRMINSQKLNKAGVRLAEVQKNGSDVISLDADPTMPRLFPIPLPKSDLGPILTPFDKTAFDKARTGTALFHDFRKDGKPYRSRSEPVFTGGRILAVVQSVRDLSPVETQIHQLDSSLATLIPLTLIVATIAGTVLVGSAMRPLRRLTESARRLDPDLSKARLPIVGNDEFADLARAFNEALDRTAGAFAAQSTALRQLERFTGDAGHELRTPLGAIKGSVTFLLNGRRWGNEARQSLEIIDRSSDRMTSLIGDLLLLARHDGGQQNIQMVPVNLMSAVREAVDLLAVPSSLRFEICIDPSLRVLGDNLSIVRAITNLLSNAFAYALTRVRISAVQRESMIEIIVEDDGDGIAPEHLSRLGQRFYRPEAARSRQQGGTGLGLAIVKSIAEAHGGNFRIESEMNVGTKAIVCLCAAEPAP